VCNAQRAKLKPLEPARDVRTNRCSQRDHVTLFQGVNNGVMVANESFHVAGAASISRAGNLLMVSQPSIGLRQRRIVSQGDELDMKSLVQRHKLSKGAKGCAIGSASNEAIDRLEIVEVVAGAALKRQLGGPQLDDEPSLEKPTKVVRRRPRRHPIALVALKAHEPLSMEPRQSFSHGYQARPELLCKPIDDDPLVIGKAAVCYQAVQLVMSQIDEAGSGRDGLVFGFLKCRAHAAIPSDWVNSSEKDRG
jgi:hypothetical protein